MALLSYHFSTQPRRSLASPPEALLPPPGQAQPFWEVPLSVLLHDLLSMMEFMNKTQDKDIER